MELATASLACLFKQKDTSGLWINNPEDQYSRPAIRAFAFQVPVIESIEPACLALLNITGPKSMAFLLLLLHVLHIRSYQI